MLQQSSPIFSNDLSGALRVITLIVIPILLPLAGLVAYFLQRSPNEKIATMQKDIDGLGGRVDSITESQATLFAKVGSLEMKISEASIALMNAVQTNGAEQIRAVHAVDREVAKLQQNNDLGKCMNEFAKSITDLALTIEHTNNNSK